jgi:hypothetical protein
LSPTVQAPETGLPSSSLVSSGFAADAGAERGIVVAAVFLVALFLVAHARRLRAGQWRHFQHLNVLADVGLGIKRQAEGERKGRRTVEFAVRGIDHLEGDALAGELTRRHPARLVRDQPADDRQHHHRHCSHHRHCTDTLVAKPKRHVTLPVMRVEF